MKRIELEGLNEGQLRERLGRLYMCLGCQSFFGYISPEAMTASSAFGILTPCPECNGYAAKIPTSWTTLLKTAGHNQDVKNRIIGIEFD